MHKQSLSKLDRSYECLISVSVIALFSLIALYLNNRAISFGLAFAAVNIYVLYSKFNLKNFFFGVTTLSIYLLVLVFAIKQDSSFGRIFIFKVSCHMLRNHLIEGIGWGQFKATYMYRQAEYFRLEHHTKNEVLLADNTYHAFNDYFEFIIENGLAGLLVVVFAFVILTKTVKLIFLNGINSISSSIAIGVIIAILVAANFNFILSNFFYQLTLVVCFYIIALKTWVYIFPNKFLTISVTILGLALASYISIEYLNKRRIKNLLSQVRNLEHSGFKKEAWQLFQSIKINGNNEDYLELKSEFLSANRMWYEAEKTTLKLMSVRPNSNGYRRLGLIYASQNLQEKAQMAYLESINMVPNRILPRFELFRLYQDIGLTELADQTKSDILKMTIKIPSETSHEILRYLREN